MATIVSAVNRVVVYKSGRAGSWASDLVKEECGSRREIFDMRSSFSRRGAMTCRHDEAIRTKRDSPLVKQ